MWAGESLFKVKKTFSGIFCITMNKNKNTQLHSIRTVTEDEENLSIPITTYQQWFEVLIKDDIQLANMILNTAPNREKNLIINCPFDFQESNGFGKNEEILKRVTLPFHLAVAFSSKEVTELLLNHNVNSLELSKTYGDNVIHSCVVIAFNKSEVEDDICEMLKWLFTKLSEEQTNQLLTHENEEGFRPIEFASQQGCLNIMKTLLETNGHVSKETVTGLGVYRHHDITEYELGERQSKSPVNMLAFLDHKKLHDPKTSEILQNPLIESWISAKIKSNTVPICIWAFLRLSFVSLFFVLDVDVGWLEGYHGNRSTEILCDSLSFIELGTDVNVTFAVCILLYIILSLSIYSIELYRASKMKLNARKYDITGKKKTLVSNTCFYKVVHTILVLTIAASTIEFLYMFAVDFKISKFAFAMADLTRILVPMLSLWSICYFLQLLPSIGSSIISIQGMVIDMGRFMLLFAIIMLPFVHAFESFTLANSKTGCVSHFQSPARTSYTLFRVMLNSYDVTELDVENVELLYVLHILYVFMVGVLLLNFLIALMSNSASKISDNKAAILKINQLALVVSLEDRIFPYCGWMYRSIRRRGFECKDGKVFLKSIACRFSQLYDDKKRLKEERIRED